MSEQEIEQKPIQQCIHMSGWNGHDHKWSDEIPWTFEEMRNFHINEREFRDIAYHFVITPIGEVLSGRPTSMKPAHATKHNQDVIAICVIGNFNKEQVNPEQRKALKNLLLTNCKQIIIPNGVPEKLCTDMHHIFGHCDYRDPPGKRYCPGTHLKRELTSIARELFIENFKGGDNHG